MIFKLKNQIYQNNFLQELSSDVGDMDGVLYVDSFIPEIDTDQTRHIEIAI